MTDTKTRSVNRDNQEDQRSTGSESDGFRPDPNTAASAKISRFRARPTVNMYQPPQARWLPAETHGGNENATQRVNNDNHSRWETFENIQVNQKLKKF